jgi:hypothetical protein
MSSESKSGANASVLALNGLRYVMPQTLSTSVLRTHKKQYSQRQAYASGETIVFDINSTGFIDPEMSYLRMTISATGAAGAFAGFGAYGSAMNVIRDVRIQSKNGTELDRIQSANEYSIFRTNYNIDKQELVANTPMTGFGTAAGVPAGTNSVIDTGNTFLIPLAWVSGLFRPHVKGQKIPPHLLSGARIELQLESFSRALVSAATGGANIQATGYTITNPQIVLMEHTLNDNSLKVLTEESANNGLEYVYDRVFTTVESTSNQNLSLQVRKAVSQATSVFCAVHPTANQTLIAQDSFLSVNNSALGHFKSFSYRLGSNYFPHQVVDENKEAYSISRMSMKNDSHGAVSTVTYDNWNDTLLQVGVQLKTDSDISSSGLAVNNSATVEIQYDAGVALALGRTYYIFMVYTALARSFLSQTSVKI